MRTLKTKFPCKTCGAPAGVERLRDEPYAICGLCADRYHAMSRVNLHHRCGADDIKRVNGKVAGPELLEGWLKGLAHHLEGISLGVPAQAVVTPADRRALAVNGLGWADFVAERLTELRPFLQQMVDGAGFGVVDGGGEAVAAPTSETVEPKLRLVRRESP